MKTAQLLARTNPAALDHWMITASGRQVWPAYLSPGDVVIDDIAEHLSKLCRFCGATRVPYSVAQHSVLALTIARSLTPDLYLSTARSVLLHDAPEAYLGDLISPVKAACRDYRVLEDVVAGVITARFKLNTEAGARDMVHRCDLIALATERRDLIASGPNWPVLAGVEPWPERIEPLSHTAARELFMAAWSDVADVAGGRRRLR